MIDAKGYLVPLGSIPQPHHVQAMVSGYFMPSLTYYMDGVAA
jgi:hypothetical protein